MSYFEFHCHTAPYSKDAGASLENVIQRCITQQVSGIAITDHNEIAGALRLRSMAPSGLTVIIGEEINTSAGEVIGLFIQEKIPAGLTPQATLEAIKRQGGITIVPHPFDRLRKRVLATAELEKNLHLIDAIEVFNARNVFQSDNQKASQFVERYGKTPICASDAHFAGEYGKTLMSGIDFTSATNFLQSLDRKNFQEKSSSLIYHLLTKCKKFQNKIG